MRCWEEIFDCNINHTTKEGDTREQECCFWHELWTLGSVFFSHTGWDFLSQRGENDEERMKIDPPELSIWWHWFALGTMNSLSLSFVYSSSGYWLSVPWTAAHARNNTTKAFLQETQCPWTHSWTLNRCGTVKMRQKRPLVFTHGPNCLLMFSDLNLLSFWMI